MENVQKTLDEEIESCLHEMKDMDPTTEDYTKIREQVVHLYKLRLEEKRMDMEAETAKVQAAAEQQSNKRHDRSQIIAAAFTVGVGVLTALLQLNGTSLMMDKVLKFEETGSIGSKAFGMIPKLNFRK